MPAPYKLILFDFDGTLVDTLGDIAHYVNEILRECGHRAASLQEVKEAVGWGVHELLKILAPPMGKDPAALEESVRIFKERYREKPVRTTRPFPGVIEALEGPLKNTPKAIVTNKPHDITLRVVEELGLSHHFKGIIGTLGDFPPKPDPASSLYFMQLFGVRADETIYVGDSGVDAQTSVAAGIDFAWVDYGYYVLKGFIPRYRFSSAAEWEILVR